MSRPSPKRRQRSSRQRREGWFQRAWRFWMNDIRSRRSCLGRALSVTAGVIIIVALVLIVVGFISARSDLFLSPETPSSRPLPDAPTSAPVSLPPSPTSLILPEGRDRAIVTNVTDGDTIEVSLGGVTERVRLIGVDTPETSHPSRPVECFGREAAAFTRAMLSGQTVVLEADPTQDNRDRFNRLLRFVWLPDGRLANYEIIAQGYGFEYTFRTPYRYRAEFRAAERAAREAQAGLWAPETCNGERVPAGSATPLARPSPTPLSVATPLPPSFDGCRTEPNAARAPNAPVVIVSIDKRAEIVTLRNLSSEPVSLDGWTMCSMRGAQVHQGIGGVLAPGETRSFPRAGGRDIWTDNTSDPGALYDAEGRLVAYWND
ncbi:MAG: nuclease [Roseiflexus castenholzii]|uniref:thermonuclease family protein n=1 Tax=Roseiflexus castenholzii TaxID=120962 RepID=UPI000CBBB8A5|nr:MAG: nuclease [Roseiflexus castenholzii]